ncbi:MAG: LysE family transporter [Paracoccaceae bacterium]
MGELSFLFAPVLAFFALAAAPGPATLSVATTAMAAGRGAAVRLSFGLALSLAGWGALAAAGLGPLLTASAAALTALKIGGGLFLLWLAFTSARSAFRSEAAVEAPLPGRRWFARGLALNAMNPKALLAWSAVIALGVGADTGVGEIWAIWAAASFTGFLIYLAYAAAFAAPAIRRGYAGGRRWIDGFAAVLFGAAGLRLLTWRVDAP